MQVRLVFLGRLADTAGTPIRDMEGALSLREVYARLEPALAEALSAPRVRIAVNGALVGNSMALNLGDGDEVAFLPPVSGG